MCRFQPHPDLKLMNFSPFDFSVEIAKNTKDSELNWNKGFSNYGNTCYINATLQVILHSTSAIRWLKRFCSNDHRCAVVGAQESVVCKLRKLMRAQSNRLTKRTIEYLRDTPREVLDGTAFFPQNQQCDAYEFLESMLSMLETGGLQQTNNPFRFQLTNVIKCSSGHISYSNESAATIQVNLLNTIEDATLR